jgi:excisionase family DNA binding protein
MTFGAEVGELGRLGQDKTTMLNERDFMTSTEAAKAIRRSDESVRKYVADGTLEGALIGGRYLITRRSVEALIKRISSSPQQRDDARGPLAHTMSATAPYRRRRGGAR